MKAMHQAPGKILNHFHGAGPLTEEMVLVRARELAVIAGHGNYTKNDLQQARQELTGVVAISTHDQEDEAEAMLMEWDADLDASGHAVEKEEALDEQTVAEQLIEEGMNEAEHERMLAAAKNGV